MGRTFNKQVTLIKTMEKNLKCFKNESELDLQCFLIDLQFSNKPHRKKNQSRLKHILRER